MATISIVIQESPTGLNLTGTVHLDVQVSPTPTRVEFYLDNVLMYSTGSSAGVYSWAWDTTREPNGTHIVRAEAVYKSRRSKVQIATTTNNQNAIPETFGFGLFGQGVFGGTIMLMHRVWNKIAGFFGNPPKNI